MTFQLDTGGRVECSAAFQPIGWAIWSDLDPFTQGYVEAVLQPREALYYSLTDRFAGFSDLAPKTLARIVEDCAEIKDAEPHEIWTKEDGEAFWRDRNDGCHLGVQPLTAYLGDDAKVYLREVGA
jgi:hypothetical protein